MNAQTRIKSRQHRSLSSQGNPECQEGNPPGATYTGGMNVTASGRTCQVWAAQQPHEHSVGTELGEHNYCRNPGRDIGGVWCYTTDPEKQWEYCAVPKCVSKSLKVLDFSADNDHEPDSNGETTGATLEAGPLPESFTICSAMMVDAWTTEFSEARMFSLLDYNTHTGLWDITGAISLFASTRYTQYEAWLRPVPFMKQVEALFFPLQWSTACLSKDSVARKVRVVVDGQLLEEKEYKREDDEYRPANISLRLGTGPVKITNLNVFNSSLSLERMVRLTRAGEEECGAPADFVSWSKAH